MADGLVFYGDNLSGVIYALDELSGTEVWSYSTVPGECGIGSSPAITDGVMYLACTDGYLYAFGTGLKYTYLDDLFAETGANQLIVTSWDGGIPVSADTVNFTVTGAGIDPDVLPELGLHASPNPFNSLSSISFVLSQPGYTSLEVFDLSGRLLATICSSELPAGEHSVRWDGRDDNGDSISAGLYLCRIFANGQSETIGLCLLR